MEFNCVCVLSLCSAYASDVSVEMARRSIRAVGKIAMRLESASEHAMGKLLAFFTLETDYVTSEALVVMQGQWLCIHAQPIQLLLPSNHKDNLVYD